MSRGTFEEQLAVLEARFRCDHETREIRQRIIEDGRIAHYRQCVRCGHAGSAVRRALHEGPLPPFDDRMEPQWRQAKFRAKQALYRERRLWYLAYLRSSDWRSLRQSVLASADYRCTSCGSLGATEVHHLTYARFGAEQVHDLEAVCRPCHERIHRVVNIDDLIRELGLNASDATALLNTMLDSGPRPR